jgi:hypothetical protein
VRAALALLLLAGCAAPAVVPPLSAGPDPLRPGPAGIAVAGTDLEIGFGRAQDGAVTAVARLIGPPEAQAPCPGGGGVVTWPTGLAMHFPGGAFAGWAQDGRSAGRLCASA